MKRLLCIVSSMDTGGAETFLMKMYRRLDRTQYQMDFIAVSSSEGHYDKEIKALGGKIYNVPLHSKQPIKAFNEIKRIVKEGEYKYVLKLLGSPVGVVDLFAAKAGGAKQLCARSCIGAFHESKLKKAINVLLRKALCRISTVKFAPSDLAARYTFGDKAYENNEVIMLHNALDLDTYCYSDVKREEVRKEFGLGTAYTIGHIGRFTQQKNHKFLIDVFTKVKEQIPNAKLFLVGTGPLLNEVKQHCADLGVDSDVIFAGVRDDVPAILSAFDLFCLPSLYEGMPNTCIEAQATGLFCVIADTITRQANITGNVSYLPLCDEDAWVSGIIEDHKIDRVQVNRSMNGSDYDINHEIGNFIHSIFEE